MIWFPFSGGDNYFSLLPGETKELEASYDVSALGGKETVLKIDGFNVAPAAVDAVH